MTSAVKFAKNLANYSQIVRHLLRCDASFVPPLTSRVDVVEYAAKLVAKGVRFEAWGDSELVGLIAAYFDPLRTGTAFISNVSVSPEWRGHGLAFSLLTQCEVDAMHSGMRHIELEVSERNEVARRLYRRFGFTDAGPTCMVKAIFRPASI